jgi:hypothetical protein
MIKNWKQNFFNKIKSSGLAQQFKEIGRAIATLMADDIFHDVAFKAHGRNDLLDGVDEFLDAVTVSRLFEKI